MFIDSRIVIESLELLYERNKQREHFAPKAALVLFLSGGYKHFAPSGFKPGSTPSTQLK